MSKNLIRFIGLLTALLACAPLAAASWPQKPVRVIVPVGPGGGLDRVARSVVTLLGESLGQVIVIDNRAGAGGDIGVGMAASATPDGYTLLIASANYVVRPAMYKVPYDPVRDFVPVTQIATVPLLLVVHASLPARSVAELVSHARSNPGKLNYSSPGNGSLVHLAGELFKSSSGIDLVHVAYKGVGAAFTDLLAGQIQMTFTGILTARPHVQSGKLRGLAVTSPRRADTASEYPTMIEAGVKNFEATQWHGLLAPRGTPNEIVDRLHRETVRIVQQPDVAKRMASDATEPVGSSRQQFAAFIKSEYDKWRRVVKQAGIKGD
ncbi:MAG: tripartite tricarboxylate transporter substrate binding protein [Burkholderiales bacterium]